MEIINPMKSFYIFNSNVNSRFSVNNLWKVLSNLIKNWFSFNNEKEIVYNSPHKTISILNLTLWMFDIIKLMYQFKIIISFYKSIHLAERIGECNWQQCAANSFWECKGSSIFVKSYLIVNLAHYTSLELYGW